MELVSKFDFAPDYAEKTSAGVYAKVLSEVGR
jgi:hypothetical protein